MSKIQPASRNPVQALPNKTWVKNLLSPAAIGGSVAKLDGGESVPSTYVSVNPSAEVIEAPAPFSPRPGFQENLKELQQRIGWQMFD